MPMYGSGYIFSKPFFTGWISVGILWLFCSSFMVGLFPLWEGRHSMARTFKGIFKDLSGKGGARRKTQVLEGTDGIGEGYDTGVEKQSHTVTEKVG